MTDTAISVRPKFRTFYAIRDAHPVGYNQLPALSVLFPEIVVWKPSFSAYRKAFEGGHCHLKPGEFFDLFKEKILQVAYDDGWDDRSFREGVAENDRSFGFDTTFVDWVDEYDARLNELRRG